MPIRERKDGGDKRRMENKERKVRGKKVEIGGGVEKEKNWKLRQWSMEEKDEREIEGIRRN